MSCRLCLVFAGSFVLAACNLSAQQDTQYDDSRNPYYKEAEQDLDNNNTTSAVSDYEAALAANPKLAGAHYQLGIIYGDKLNDPVGAIYHFRKYLELDPASDKADQVKALIEKQSQAFAASVPNSPAQSADASAQLQADNATLKQQVADAAKTIAQLQAQRAAAGVAPTPAPGSPSVPPRALPLDATNAAPLAAGPPGATNSGEPGAPNRTYKVVSGDSLWKISHKMYPGDTKNGIDKIKEANKDTLIEGKPLKIGQVLIIPP
ncbi:MAG: LysM peptidoglycan-binding domain-containing protein [Methylacidiphilales bacterium]|nr:LysM peptidoglycan-binding domain-containing protein [Candidatus Methylacidiphilales bacterium]